MAEKKHYKKSIRFFNDREVRAVWDDELSKWWFSAIDIVRAINDEEDYTKSRNYWKYLKGRLTKEGVELVSTTNHFKFEAPDGKMRTADVLDGVVNAIQQIAQTNNALSENSKDQAYAVEQADIGIGRISEVV